MTRNLLTVVLLLFIGLQGLNTTSSCDNSCDTDASCDVGFHCCNSQCVPLPGIGEDCPCSRCNSDILLCKQGICMFNGINCTCNNASDCSSDGSRPATCINNICGLQQIAPIPSSPTTIGQSCVDNTTCYETRYCNSSNICDYIPSGYRCNPLPDYCRQGYVCAGYQCRPRRDVNEPCDGNEQCPPLYTCRAADASSQQYCTTKGEIGDYCTEASDCANNANCVNNACYLPGIGEQCFMGWYCASSLVCRFGKCASNATLPNGSQCQRYSDCTSGICSQGLCWPISYTSGSCNVSEQCPDGRCVNGKCFSIAFYNEKCNATQVCYDENRPCVNGTCPRLYSAYGEYCAVNEHCLFGTCIANSCGLPSSCNVSTDCGSFSICDCGQCKPNRIAINNAYAYRPSIYLRLAFQMTTRRPEQTCLSSVRVEANCEATVAKYNCFVGCGRSDSWGFPNGIINFSNNNSPDVAPTQVDCKNLRYSQPSNPQSCCNAYNQTACNTKEIVGCYDFNLLHFDPLMNVPEAPSTPLSVPSAAPTATPSVVPPVAPSSPTAPSVAPVTIPSAAPTATPSVVPSTVPVFVSTPTNSNPSPTAQPSSMSPTPVTCNCAASTPICDTTINACVGQRVTPIVQCVQYSNNQYIAFMSYNNRQSSVVTLDDKINFLNVGGSNKPRDFAVGRPFVFPQSAFNVTSTTAQQVTWYLDGFELKFDLDDESIACPQDVTFVMTSSATVDQLVAIADDIVGNLSSIMSISESRLNVTFSSVSSKRQTSSSLITVVVLSSSSSEPTPFTAALQFISSDSNEFMTRVPAALVSQVIATPLPNEQTGSETVTPPTSDSSPVRSSPPPSQSPRTVVSRAHNTIVHVSLIMCIVSVLLS